MCPPLLIGAILGLLAACGTSPPVADPVGAPPTTTVPGSAPVPGSVIAPRAPTTPDFDYAGAAETLTMGGPGATVGNEVIDRDCPQFQPTARPMCGPQPGYWAAINGPFADFRSGDPYSTRCGPVSPDTDRNRTPPSGSTKRACSSDNPLYRSEGSTFAIDVAPTDVGRPLSVDGFDVGVYRRTVRRAGPSTTRGLDADCDLARSPFADEPQAPESLDPASCQTGDAGEPQHFDLEVFDNGGNDGGLQFDRGVPGCHMTMGAGDLMAQTDTFKNNWVRICTFTPSQVGVYALRVRNSGLPGLADIGDGTNAYALRVTGGRGTRLYPVGDQSTWMNSAGVTPSLPLARVPDRFAGHRLVIDAFDPGDGVNTASGALTVRPPPQAAPWADGSHVLSCSYNAVPSADRGPATPDRAEGCAVATDRPGRGGARYDGQWLRIVVDLDPAYRCPGDCYWTISYDFGPVSYPTDRVVWAAAIE